MNTEWLDSFFHITAFLLHAAEDVGVVADHGGDCLLPFSRELVEHVWWQRNLRATRVDYRWHGELDIMVICAIGEPSGVKSPSGKPILLVRKVNDATVSANDLRRLHTSQHSEGIAVERDAEADD